MRMPTLFASTVLAATVLASSAAFAAPITFTWNPNGTSGTALSSAGSALTASNITVADYATLNVASLAAVTESGWLAVTAFNTSLAPGFVGGSGGGAASANPGATPYQLYFQFSSTSHLTPVAPGFLSGSFDTLSYTLYGDVGGSCTFGLAGLSCGGDTQLVLATGGLAYGGTNQVSIFNNIPSASVDLSIVLGANAGAFFVNPSDITNFAFESSFTNTPGVVTQTGSIITINGGGGNVDLTKRVPEPVTLSIFGAGLAGAAALRRRKVKKA